MIELIQTIALLCQMGIAGDSRFATFKTSESEQLQCQKYYLACVKDLKPDGFVRSSGKMSQGEALAFCMEKKL